MPQPLYSADLAPLLKLKTAMKGKRSATIEKKRKIETGAIGDTKKCISGVFREWKKC